MLQETLCEGCQFAGPLARDIAVENGATIVCLIRSKPSGECSGVPCFGFATLPPGIASGVI